MSRFRHYVNLDRSEDRLAGLLAEFRWTTVRDVLETWKHRGAGPSLAAG